MKKIAFFLFFLFAAAQVIPLVINYWGTEKALIFNVDEEKQSSKGSLEEKKEKKDAFGIVCWTANNSATGCFTITPDELLVTPPFLEKSTPPPNFLS